MKINCLIILFTFLLTSCEYRFKSELEQSIWNQFDNDKDSCEVEFSGFLPNQWDTVWFFSNKYEWRDIYQEMGFNPHCFIDIGDRIIFVKSHRVVYYQEWFPYYKLKQWVGFGEEKFCLSRDSAIFTAKKIKFYGHDSNVGILLKLKKH